jgi:hypothetical protein
MEGQGFEEVRFRYEPRCSASGCDRQAIYKVASPWSSATSRELKNYGLACEDHRLELLERAKRQRLALAPAEWEVVGEVGLYPLQPGRRDMELSPLTGE